MMQANEKEIIWCEKYRPRKIEDVIIPESIKKQFRDIIEKGHIGNLLLSGMHGTGKTTIARAVCEDIGLDYEIINASDNRGLDLIREDIKNFASRVSITGNGKCIILDEADNLTGNTQAALRGAMEHYSKTCSFILTCNFPNKIMPALHSRCKQVKFEISEKERKAMMKQMMARVVEILDNEGIPYNKMAVATLINHYYPDNRKILNEMDAYAKSGEIDEGILNQMGQVSIGELVKFMKEKKFKNVRQWCAENAYNDIETLYSAVYENLDKILEPKSIPECILILEDYQRHDSTVPDREIHVAALCTELMMRLEFK